MGIRLGVLFLVGQAFSLSLPAQTAPQQRYPAAIWREERKAIARRRQAESLSYGILPPTAVTLFHRDFAIGQRCADFFDLLSTLAVIRQSDFFKAAQLQNHRQVFVAQI